MSRYRDRYRMSSSKSDPKDAMVLANILRTNLYLYKPLPRETVDDARLRQLTRAHKSLVQQGVKLLNQLISQLKSYYPVALRLFSRLDHKITLAFLERFPVPEKATKASIEDLRRFFHEQVTLINGEPIPYTNLYGRQVSRHPGSLRKFIRR